MDPQTTNDGKPYGPIRYEEIVKERYVISKAIHTSYNDVGKITPAERQYILKYLVEEAQESKERLKKLEESRKK